MAALELTLVAALFTLYRLGRRLSADESLLARKHAATVHQVEAALHLPSEAALQNDLGAPWFLHAANVYYVSAHFPVTVAFLVWLYVRGPREHYRWARNLMVAVTTAALLIHIAFPLAPPRMFPQWGFVDTMQLYGPNAYGGPSAAVSNQLAAMPSLHVGWALLIAFVVRLSGPRWLAVLASLHAATTVVVVVVTGNHWWVDAGMAALLVASAVKFIPARHLRSAAAGAPGPGSDLSAPVRRKRRTS